MATREIRKQRSKKKINYDIPVLVVFRSTKNILAQVLEPKTKKTLFTVSSYNMKKGTKSEKAELVGEQIAKKAKTKKIERMVVDRNGFTYHGRIKALVDSVRKNGITI